jgi:mono/diheme cytochrome c family protein
MDYPVWQLGAFGGGLLIALIATVHVFVAHFAVGGGLYLALTERFARARALPAVLEHVKRHARFFMLLTMVFGGLTGVGIWFTISLLSPAATALLIHKFVFFFAAEWAAFVVEIAALLVYYYRFDQMGAREHQIAAWIYVAAAWASLFFIGGIVSFMLTPGEWLASGNVWDGFFNPSLWPSVALRTAMALLLAGVFGFVGALRVKDASAREQLVRYCAVWAAAPFFAVLASGLWYLGRLSPASRALVLGGNPEIAPYLNAFRLCGPAVAVLAAIMAVRLPGRVRAALCLFIFVLGYAYIGSFEYVREAARRPYLIVGAVYSTGLAVADAQAVKDSGVLGAGGWSTIRRITAGNEIQAGREIFTRACLACHSLGGPMQDIVGLTAKYPRFGAEAMLAGLGRISAYMPPFPGTDRERKALAAYLTEGLHGKKPPETAFAPKTLPQQVPAVEHNREYTLTAWSAQGLMFFSDADETFQLLPPWNTLRAMLIKRGDPPQIVTRDVEIGYRLETDSSDPAARLAYWQFAEGGPGGGLPANTGAAGLGTSGTMRQGAGQSAGSGIYQAAAVPVSPYVVPSGLDPYPLVTVEARQAGSGALLASTTAVLPASTEMGCKNCHGGPWRVAGAMGVGPETAGDIVAEHDRRNGTDLAGRAKAGHPAACGQCHADPATGAPGDGKRLNLSAAVHGLHAAVLAGAGDKACTSCHPADPAGATRAYRGVHLAMGLACADCHGALDDFALSLLRAEQDKTAAAGLMANLTPRAAALDKISPRSPWTAEPDCLTCHKDFGPGGSGADTGFNVWTKNADGLFAARRDEMGAVACAACHGAPHAEYPAQNPYGENRDNIQPLQYQNLAAPLGAKGGCAACHTAPMDASAHHPLPE